MTFLLAYLLFLVQPNVSVSISEGIKEQRPATYAPLEEFEHLAINTAYWAKVSIDVAEEGEYVLVAGKPNMQVVQFLDDKYQPLKTGNNLIINVKERGIKVVYLHYPFVDEKDKNLLSISVHPLIDFVKSRNQTLSYQYSFHAILTFPLMIGIFFGVFNRQWVYIFYSAYILSLMFFFGYQYGLIGDLIPVFNQVPPIWIWFFGFLMTFFYLLFSRAFLDLKRTDPFADRVIRFGLGFIIVFFLISIALHLANVDVQHSMLFKGPFLLIEAALIVIFIYRVFKLSIEIKYYYLIGFLILITISFSGQVLSTSQQAIDYNHLYQSGLVLEVFILALGLGARVNSIQKAEVAARESLIKQLQINEQMQEKYATELEAAVVDRTHELQKKNQAFEFLLKEVHHRVKNNLQMIVSLLNMQQRRVKTDQGDEIFNSTRNKIKSLAIIHEALYKSEDLSKIELKVYLTELTEVIIRSFRADQKLRLDVQMDEIVVDIDTGISLGLILNELLTNSLKYGIKNTSEPKLAIKLTHDESIIELGVWNNGVEENADQITYGLGYTIIESILESHDGSLKIEADASGFSTRITLQKTTIES